MLVVQPTQAADALDGILLADAAADRVGGIGRINDDATAPDNLDRLFYQARLGIFRVDLEELTHIDSLFSGQQ
ncbi:hypothetical protein D9M69_554040 [compost metagenome]